jgi:malonyl-CoA O-methyltransferase
MRHNFSIHATQYDLYAVVQRRAIEHLTSQLKNVSPEPGLMLDIGTGTGALAEELEKLLPNNPLVVMDIAHGMTCQARNRLPFAKACDGDARSLPFGERVFTTVASSSVYQWVECLPTAFKETSRVLQSNGILAVALFGHRTLFELRTAHQEAVHDSGSDRLSHVQNFPSLEEVSSALINAGLRIRSMASCYEVEYHSDVPELMRQLKKIGASNASRNRPRGLSSRRVMQKMISLYEGYRTGNGLPATYEIIIAVAEKTGN